MIIATMQALPEPANVSFVRTFFLILKLALFLLLLALAVQNSESVSVRYFFGQEWQAPMALVIFLAFAAGLVVGLLACAVRLMRQKREMWGLRKQLKSE